ncbi:hypothetical protein FVE85_0311 [Porphyridium purpureum]|uniref:Zinc-finger domain-containing protein n=1 Tax=Porphyridium purpureum TaxID=35688 RepID=A0A5J4Z0I0_PORPP|nr:hypothetical protein FVE85_0311 [Porphyridium purpureum]|eukprot:POR4764..scf208_2
MEGALEMKGPLREPPAAAVEQDPPPAPADAPDCEAVGERTAHKRKMEQARDGKAAPATTAADARHVGAGSKWAPSERQKAAGVSEMSGRQSDEASQSSMESRKRVKTYVRHGQRVAESTSHVPLAADTRAEQVLERDQFPERPASMTRSASATDVTSHAEKETREAEPQTHSAAVERPEGTEQKDLFQRIDESMMSPANLALASSNLAAQGAKTENRQSQEAAPEAMEKSHSNTNALNGTRGHALSSAASTKSFCENASSKTKHGSSRNAADGRPSELSTGSHAKRNASDREPSRFCHICQRKQGVVKHIVCCNISQGSCRKVVCELCFEDNDWDFEAALAQRTSWACPHCLGLCPPRAQCKTYERTNDRRRNGTLNSKKPKKVVNDGKITAQGHMHAPQHVPAPGLYPYPQVYALPHGQEQQFHAHRVQQSALSASRPAPLNVSRLASSSGWPAVEPGLHHQVPVASNPYAAHVGPPPNAGGFAVYYEYTYAPPQTEPIPTYSLFDGLPF